MSDWRGDEEEADETAERICTDATLSPAEACRDLIRRARAAERERTRVVMERLARYIEHPTGFHFEMLEDAFRALTDEDADE